MSGPDTEKLKQQLLIGFLAVAKHELSDEDFNAVQSNLTRTVGLALEIIPLESLTDPDLIRGIIRSLHQGRTIEDTLFRAFSFHIAKLISNSSKHPLEIGIIKQKISGVLPIFEGAVETNKISKALYERLAPPLTQVTNRNESIEAALQILSDALTWPELTVTSSSPEN